MILEQGRIIEFDRYAELSVVEEKLTLLYAQACHPVEKLNLRILFVVQSNGKRRICNVERNGRSLDNTVAEGSTVSLRFNSISVTFGIQIYIQL